MEYLIKKVYEKNLSSESYRLSLNTDFAINKEKDTEFLQLLFCLKIVIPDAYVNIFKFYISLVNKNLEAMEKLKIYSNIINCSLIMQDQAPLRYSN